MSENKIVSELLTNVSIHYKNAAYVAQMLLPRLPVTAVAGEYVKYGKEDAFTLSSQKRGPKSQAQEVDWSSTTEKYKLESYALKDSITDRIRDAGSRNSMDIEVDTVDFLTDLLMLGREKRLAALVTDTTKMTNNTTLSGTSQFSDYVHSNPLSVLLECRDQCFMEPNMMVMPQGVWAKLQFHPLLVKSVYPNGDGSGIVTIRQLSELLGIGSIFIAKGKYNTAAKGKPAVYQNLWGKDIVMAYVSPTISPKTVSLGWDFTLSHGVLSDGEEQTYRVRKWRDESIGGGGDWIEVDYEAEAAIVCPDVGFLIKNAVA